MTTKLIYPLLITSVFLASCNSGEDKKTTTNSDVMSAYQQGSFGYDRTFLQKVDDSLIILTDKAGGARVIVSPKYQAKVFTSTAAGDSGVSFGWVNYKAFSGAVDAHMNAYGGENRLWLGPEGGKFSLFFTPGRPMIFDNWKTPPAIDTEPWMVTGHTDELVKMQKAIQLINYNNTPLDVLIDRSVKILSTVEISQRISFSLDSAVKAVGYHTENVITNSGNQAWTESTGMPCIWILDMFKPTPRTTIVIPFKKTKVEDFEKVATTNYFGQIPPHRIKHTADHLFFKADGKSRGKLGINPAKATPVAGSYDAENKVLTITFFDIDSSAKYLNQEWNTTKPPFSGDAVNAYNDGPLEDGTQMGPFYELESVSPAAFLKPGQSLSHHHTVIHFTGTENVLDQISTKLLGISLKDISSKF
jgi:hypothetical protein